MAGEVTKRFYLKALGSVLYDQDHIVCGRERVDVRIADTITSCCSAPAIRWGKWNGWFNQPKVILFNATESEARQLRDHLVAGNLPFIVVPKHWS